MQARSYNVDFKMHQLARCRNSEKTRLMNMRSTVASHPHHAKQLQSFKAAM